MIIELPEPAVLARQITSRRADTTGMLRQLTNVSEYITSFARELDRGRRHR